MIQLKREFIVLLSSARVLSLGMLFLSAPTVLSAQSPRLAFAAVSIKRAPPGRWVPGRVAFNPGGGVTADGVTAVQLIRAAYGLPRYTVRLEADGMEWINSEKYVVEAVTEPGSVPASLPGAQLRQHIEPMLQQLLADRFKLAIRREPKDMAVYALRVAASGSKLIKSVVTDTVCQSRSPADGNDCHRFDECVWGKGCRGDAVSMDDLAFELEHEEDRPVMNETGIKGLFSIRLRSFRRFKPLDIESRFPDLPAEALPDFGDRDGPTLSKALELDLGLKLEPTHAQVKVLKIVRIERPSPN